MKFIHIADIHFGKRFSTSRFGADFAEKRRREIGESLARLIDFANSNDVDYILCAGDLLHSDDVKTSDLKDLNEIISRLNRGLFITVTGNHDPLGKMSGYGKIKWTEKLYIAPAGFSRLYLEEHDTAIYTYSWDKKHIKENPLEEISLEKKEKASILLLHGDTAAPQSEYLPLNLKSLTDKGFDYIALGHIHKPGKVGDRAFYSGSFEPLDSTETGEHGFYLCHTENIGSPRFIPFSFRKYIDLEVAVTSEFSQIKIAEKIASSLSSQRKEDIFNITLTGTHSAGAAIDTAELETLLLKEGYLCQVADKTRPDYDLNKLFEENRKNIIGEFIASFGDIESMDVDSVEYKALIYGVDALLAGKGVQ